MGNTSELEKAFLETSEKPKSCCSPYLTQYGSFDSDTEQKCIDFGT